MRRRSRSGLPLAVWALVLGGGAVLAVVTVITAVLFEADALSDTATQAIAAGGSAGMLVVLCAVIAATKLAESVRSLHRDAVQRLAQPGMPLGTSWRLVTQSSVEVAELARTLDALHLRVRMADQLGERHRREAETAGAGVFELLSGLVAAEEGARGPRAPGLHDTVAQSLMIARGLLAAGPVSEADLVKLTDYVEDAEEQVRAVMARTRPPALREGDLASAVGGLRLDMGARYGLQVDVQWPESPYPLPLASAVTVYRFFQEALLNVVKHADVDDAHVSLIVEEKTVVATVRDEGPGFEPESVRPDRGRHVGLGLLRERARLSGGSLEVVSARGEGTTLTLTLPRPQQVPGFDELPHVPQQASEVRRRLSDRAIR
jgi:signal transduction histidine kinase